MIRSPKFWWVSLLAGGVVLRIVIWWLSIGSNDVPTWLEHATNVRTKGLAETFRTSQQYNHPPLIGLYVAWVGGMTDDLLAFARMLKIPALVGEGLALLGLWKIGGLRLAAVYGALPAPILVAAYHGNTDCLYAGFALLAAVAWDRGRHVLSGLCLAAALNVKLIPLVLVPMFVLSAPSWPVLLRFSAALALGLVSYVPCVLAAGEAMYRNMVAYNSNPDEWGFLAVLNEAELLRDTSTLATTLRVAFLQSGRYLVMGGCVAIAILSRARLRFSMTEQAALASALFLVLAPGFGVQYVAFAAPLVLAVSRPAGVFWGVVSGVFIGALYVVYSVPGKAGWYSQFRAPFHGWTPEVGLVAWAGLAAWLVIVLVDRWRAGTSEETDVAEAVS